MGWRAASEPALELLEPHSGNLFHGMGLPGFPSSSAQSQWITEIGARASWSVSLGANVVVAAVDLIGVAGGFVELFQKARSGVAGTQNDTEIGALANVIGGPRPEAGKRIRGWYRAGIWLDQNHAPGPAMCNRMLHNYIEGPGTGDYDNDGILDAHEFVAGTAPHNAASVPALLPNLLVNAQGVTVQWWSTPDRTCRLQFRNALTDVGWQTVPGDVTATGPTASKTEAGAAPPTRRVIACCGCRDPPADCDAALTADDLSDRALCLPLSQRERELPKPRSTRRASVLIL